MKRHTVGGLALLVIIPLFTGHLAASEHDMRGAVMLLALDPIAGVESSTEEVIVSAVELYLEQHGIVTPDASPISPAPAEQKEIAALFSRFDIDFILTISGRTDGPRAIVALKLQTQESGTLARAEATNRLDLRLDRALFELTEELLSQARSAISNAAARRAAQRAAPAEAAPGEQTAQRERGQAVSPPREQGQSQKESAQRKAAPQQEPEEQGVVGDEEPEGAALPGAAARLPQQRQAAERAQRWEIGTGFAPVMPVGESARYFTFAYGAAFYADYLVGEERNIGFGVIARGSFAEAAGAASTAELLFVPVAAEIRYSSSQDALGGFVHLGAGASLLRAENRYLGEFLQIVPYAEGGLGLKLSPFDHGGAAVGISYAAYMEGSLWIMELSPSVFLYTGF